MGDAVKNQPQETVDQNIDQLHNLLKNNTYDQLKECWNKLSPEEQKTIQAQLENKTKTETDSNKQNEYQSLIDIFHIWDEFKQLSTTITNPPISAETTNTVETIDTDCLTFHFYSGLKKDEIQSIIISKVQERNDPAFTKLRLNFKTLTTPQEKENNMILIQRYLNNINGSPYLSEDGKFWKQTYKKLQQLSSLQESTEILATASSENITITESDIGTGIRLSWRKGEELVTKELLLQACNTNTIPKSAKEKIQRYLQNSDNTGLQKYLNDLLNPTTPIKEGPYIDKWEFAQQLTQKYSFIDTETLANWKDRNNVIYEDGWIWPQCITAIRCIKEKQPEVTNSTSQNPEQIKEQQKTNIKNTLEQPFTNEQDKPTVEVDLDNKKINLTFKEQKEWTEQENKFVYNYAEGKISLEDKPNNILTINDLKIQDLSTNNSQIFQGVAKLTKLFSKNLGSTETHLYKYDEEQKKIQIQKFEQGDNDATPKPTPTWKYLFDSDDAKTNELATIDSTHFSTTNILTSEGSQKAIAKFMTVAQMKRIEKNSKIVTYLKDTEKYDNTLFEQQAS